MKNERKTNHAFCIAFRAPSLILCFLAPRVPHRPQCAATLLFAEMYVPGGACVCCLKKNIDFLLFYDFVAEIYKKQQQQQHRNKWDEI